MPEFTTVVGVDAKTLPQLELTLPTWHKYRPEMFRQPWLIFYDRVAVTLPWLRRTVGHLLHGCDVRAVAWPSDPRACYPTQRERMLSGFVHAPRFVATDWWLKVDTDAVALHATDWLPPAWFEQQPQPEQPKTDIDPYIPYAPGYNVWIASPWGYTKPADQMQQLDAWGDGVDALQPYPRLDVPFEPGARRARHRRMASWVSFYRTDWSRYASEVARHYCSPNHIPVPSQDGYHFYFAQRRGDRYLRAQMKRRGWTNCPRAKQLMETTAKAMAGEYE